MESTERLLRTWMASGREDEIVQTVSDISSGHSSLLNVVKALGEYLTSEEDILRTKGVDFLSQVIERCPPGRINRQATHVLSKFYSGKLEDSETIIPALRGLVPLSVLSTFTSDDAVEIAKTVFTRVEMKEHAQSTRYLVFKVLDSLMARHREALQGMGAEFLDGYTSLVDGEKDPRNLMMAFAIDRVICIEFDISHHVEKLFNIIFCYVPITFKPPPDDPYGITTDDLKSALRLCLNASPLFGHLAIPLFLEKLLSGSPATKRDILETITICLPLYGLVSARDFAKKLWNLLKLEIFQPVNSEIEGEALKSTQVLITTIYDRTSTTEDDFGGIEGLVNEICEECLELMNEPEKSQAIPASKVIAALIGTTPNITQFVFSQTVSHLMKLFRDPGELIHRPQILTLLCVLVSAVDAKQSTLVEDFGLHNQLLTYKDELLGAFITGTKTANSREAALEGVKRLIQVKGLLTEEELVYVVHNINEILQSVGEQEEVASDDALDVLIATADINSKVIEDYTLPLLFTSLPDAAPTRDAHGERVKVWITLRWLARLCVSAPLFETLVVRLSTKLDLICAPKGTDDSIQDVEPRAAYAHSILKTLCTVLELKVNARHADVPKYIDRLIPGLFNLFIYLSLGEKQGGGLISEPRLLNMSKRIITLVLQVVPIERQRKFAIDLYFAYFQGQVKRLAAGHQILPDASEFKPFEKSSPSAQKNLVVLFAAAVVAFQKEVIIPDHDANRFLSDIQSWSLDIAENDMQREAAHQVISSLLNKNTDKFQAFISKQLSSVWAGELADNLRPVTRRRCAINCWLWISRALLVRNHELAMEFAIRLFELFEDEQVSWDAARTVGEIASVGDDVLAKSNHAVVRILFAQKYFRGILPKILESLKGVIQSADQTANLLALTSLITSLPKTTYIGEMSTLMPLLIRGLELPDVEMRTKILNTLLAVADGPGQSQTQEHATSLLPIALKNAKLQDLTSVNLRIASLKYITILPKVVRYDILHPRKSQVIQELSKVLDDPKKAVRKEAVEARVSWFLYRG